MLSHKYGSVLKEYLSRKQQLGFVKSYSKLPKSLSSYLNLCLAYSKLSSGGSARNTSAFPR